MKVIPMQDYAIVKEVDGVSAKKSTSQLVVPDNIKNDYFLLAEVVSAGPGFLSDKYKETMLVGAGDVVICNKLTALPLKMVDEKTYLINAESIFGMVKE